MLTHGSLFSGIGGFEKGANMAGGIKNIWACEIDLYRRKILQKHNTNLKIYDDIRTLDNAPRVDIITGGFPCQDISISGKGLGLRGERSGLWYEMYRVLRNLRPRYIIIENSPVLTFRGLETILSQLSTIGYDAEWKVISNLQFGFPHKRERLYIIAYSNKVRTEGVLEGYRTFRSIFKQLPSKSHIGFDVSKRFFNISNAEWLGTDYGIPNRAHRIGAIGDTVNPFVTKYLFECIKDFDNEKIHN